MTKRNLFNEMMHGVAEMAQQRAGDPSGKIRAAFEAYIAGPQFDMPPEAIERDAETGEYLRHDVQTHWLVWLASRASAAVELPAIEAWDNDGRLDREPDDDARERIGLVPSIDVRLALMEIGITTRFEEIQCPATRSTTKTAGL